MNNLDLLILNFLFIAHVCLIIIKGDTTEKRYKDEILGYFAIEKDHVLDESSQQRWFNVERLTKGRIQVDISYYSIVKT